MNILVLGATSTIASQICERYAQKKANFSLISRNEEYTNQIADDLKVKGAGQVNSFIYDFQNVTGISGLFEQCWPKNENFDLVIIAFGGLTNQDKAETDSDYWREQLDLNLTSVLLCMGECANRLESQQKGTLAVFGSVAGDRGRPSNYAYGCTKAAIEAVAQGMRARLYKKGAHLLLVKPGIIHTKMTAGLKNLPEKLVSEPFIVAKDFIRAVERKKDLVYTPSFWKVIMLIIRNIPEFVYKKISL